MNRQQSLRGQSHVVGVALLMGIAVVALAGLTVTVGSVVSSNAAQADANRVAEGLADGLEPVETNGDGGAELRFTDGSLRTVDRDVRVIEGSTVRHRVAAGGLVFEAGDRRVAYVADAILQGSGSSAWLRQPPPVTTSRDGEVIVLSVAKLNASHGAVTGNGQTTVRLDADVTHERTELGNGTFGMAIETETPGPLVRWFRDRNATVSVREFDDDGVESVVAEFPGDREGYLVVHDMHLGVNDG
jgi:hypothetical protein